MENKKTADCLEFPIDRWLDEDEDDGDIVREVAAEIPGEEPKPGNTGIIILDQIWILQ